MVKSAEKAGVDTKVTKGVAVAMSTRRGLDIRFSTAIAENGAWTIMEKSGRRLILINPSTSQALKQTVLHEYLHDIMGDSEKTANAVIHDTEAAYGKEFKEYIDANRDAYFDAQKKAGNTDLITTTAEDGTVTRSFASKNAEAEFNQMMREEAAANFGAKMLDERGYLDRLAESNRKGIVKAWNKLKQWISDVRTKDLATARLMERYTQSIAKYVGTTYAVESTMASVARETDNRSVRFSIKDGKVIVDTDRGIFDGIDRKDYGKTVRAYMREHFRGKIISDTVFTSISEGEYTSSKYTKGLYSANDGLYDAKMQASTELDNIVSSGKFIGHEDAKHPHSYNGNGYDRFEIIFSIDGEDFIGEMLVAINNENKRTFYDIVRIKRDAFNRATDIADHDKHISNRSIAQNGTKVNRNFKKNRAELKIGNETADVSVQETKNLVAIHNLSEKKLLDTLKLGGFPMPSIAIVKADQGHNNYGDISVVFGKNTIDPQADANNKVYGGDAWTPTMSQAQTEYEVNYDKMRSFEKHIEQLSKKTAGGAFYNTSIVSRLGVEDASTKNATELAEQIARTDEARAAYLADKGKELTPEYKKKEYNKFGNEALQEYIDSIGIQRIANAIAEYEAKDMSAFAFETEKETITDIIRKRYIDRRYNALKNNRNLKGKDVRAIVEQQADSYIQNNITIFSIEDFVKDAWKYYQEGGAVTEEIDRLATSEKLRQSTNEKDVIAWLEPQITEFIGEPAIYNGTDIYKSNGDRKSFAQTHYTYTAENIVRVMKQGKKRGEGTFGANANSVIATATPSYKSISDIHADENRLQIEDQGKYDAILNDLENSLRNIEDDILRTTKHTADNTFEETQTIGGIITDAALGTRTVSAIQKEFLQYGYSITQSQAKKILDLYKSAATVPTGYFESKPERVVDFSEIQMIELPNNASEHLKAELDKRGIPYELYGSTDEERTEAVKRLDNVRFELSQDRGFTKGQAAKIVANATREKVYSKAEAEKAIDNVTALVSDLTSDTNVLRRADIRGKNRAEVLDYLWERMNTTQEKDRLNVALNTAEYIINNAIVQEEYNGHGAEEYHRLVNDANEISHLKKKFYFNDAEKAELKKQFGNRYGSVLRSWYGENGSAPSAILQELRESGVRIQSDTNVETEVFEDIMKHYDAAKTSLELWNDTLLRDIADGKDRSHLKSEMAHEILRAFDTMGEKSAYRKSVETQQQRISDLIAKQKEKLKAARKRSMAEVRLFRDAIALEDLIKRNRQNSDFLQDSRVKELAKMASKIGRPRNARNPASVMTWAKGMQEIYSPIDLLAIFNVEY